MKLFLTLKVFAVTGGIEKVCRVWGKALYELGLENDEEVRVFSMHGPAHAAKGNKYFPAEIFSGFGGKRVRFIREALRVGRKADVVILSHINLLLAAWLIKKANPRIKIILIAHGIEIWQPLNARQRIMLNACDRIIAVSRFTRDRIEEVHHLPAEKLEIINNCIDPFLSASIKKGHDSSLMERYNISKDDLILLTLTRLSERDRYKGYDYVLQALAGLIAKNKHVKYLLAGGYDAAEKKHIDELIASLGLENHVILTGYVREEELPMHFALADIYVMPSVKEGFGIVFVEAMYYGVPAIAANRDGSVDALLDGRLGLLIDPCDPAAIENAVLQMMESPGKFSVDHKLLVEHFGYDTYKEKLSKILQASSKPKKSLTLA